MGGERPIDKQKRDISGEKGALAALSLKDRCNERNRR